MNIQELITRLNNGPSMVSKATLDEQNLLNEAELLLLDIKETQEDRKQLLYSLISFNMNLGFAIYRPNKETHQWLRV